jgi:hypothetical protein
MDRWLIRHPSAVAIAHANCWTDSVAQGNTPANAEAHRGADAEADGDADRNARPVADGRTNPIGESDAFLRAIAVAVRLRRPERIADCELEPAADAAVNCRTAAAQPSRHADSGP